MSKQVTIDTIHSIFCSKHHNVLPTDYIKALNKSDDYDDCCFYYVERKLSDDANKPTINYWTKLTTNFIDDNSGLFTEEFKTYLTILRTLSTAKIKLSKQFEHWEEFTDLFEVGIDLQCSALKRSN